MSATKKTLLAVGSLVALFVLPLGGMLVVFYHNTVFTVMEKQSPQSDFTAKLVRRQGIDVNFELIVSGRRVYWSPDFAPVDADFREQIAWDRTGQIVVLEVAGERLFGYHAVESRPLTAAELGDIQFTPLEELRFEGTVPNDENEVR